MSCYCARNFLFFLPESVGASLSELAFSGASLRCHVGSWETPSEMEVELRAIIRLFCCLLFCILVQGAEADRKTESGRLEKGES